MEAERVVRHVGVLAGSGAAREITLIGLLRLGVAMELVVQIQTDRLAEVGSCDALIDRVASLARDAEIEYRSDDGLYVLVSLRGPEIEELWLKLQRLLEEVPSLAQASIVVAQGPSGGWDGYYLLHHFDESEKTNSLQ
jgi:hypothetical protein